MKFSIMLAFLLLSTTATGKEFEYPKLITCKPTKQYTINAAKGIKENSIIKEHVFVYIANGKYKYKKDVKKKYSTTFNSGISNQDSVLNIYSDAAFFSVALYQNYYVMSLNLPDINPGMKSVFSVFLQGDCDIKWK